MIYLTGDIHGANSVLRLSSKHWAEGSSLTRDDYVVILGDFGLVWSGDEDDNLWLDWLESRPWTTLFVDGNHENHRLLSEYPESSWHGGVVHRVRPHVLHLMRGYVFEIDGRSFLSMGGANSHDIQWRTEGVSWWPEEVPSEGERSRCLDSLDAVGWHVDYVLTHDAPAFMVSSISDVTCNPMHATEYETWLASVWAHLEYERWFCGHFHLNAYHDGRRIMVLYDDIVSLEESIEF